MKCSRSIMAVVAALAFSETFAQLGNAPASALSAPGSSFSRQSAPAVGATTPKAGVAPMPAMTPGQMTQPKPPAEAASASAAKQVPAAEKTAPVSATRLTEERLTIVSPRRAQLMQKYEALRTQQAPIAQPVQRNPGPGIAPGVMASTAAVKNYATTHTPQTAAVATIHKLTEPGIALVNGKWSAIHVTPGAKLVISGYGFGDAKGNAYLVGGGLEKQPLLLLIGKWRNDEIEASIPGGTRGVADEAGASVKVVTAAGAAYRMDGIVFYAAREETTLTGSGVSTFFIVEAGATWREVDTGGAGAARYDASPQYGKGIDCKRPGTDVLRFRAARGFEVIGATLGHGRTDSGDGDENGKPGGRVFFPGYGFGAWTDERVTRPLPGLAGLAGTEEFTSALAVNWGVFRSHTSPQLDAGANHVGVVPVPAVNYGGERDTCSSKYAITSLQLYGPAGVSPF